VISYGTRVGAGSAAVGSSSSRQGGAYRLGLVAITTFVVQHTIFSVLRIHGAQPDLMLGLVVLVALDGGPRRGALFGFGVGLGVDLFVMTPFGLSALTFTLIGYAVGKIRESRAGGAGALITMVVAAGGAIVGTLGYALLLVITGGTVYGLGWIVLTVTLVNTILAVPTSRVVRWAARSGSGFARSRSRSGLGGAWR
jgi:rod shape-determining protein MreD